MATKKTSEPEKKKGPITGIKKPEKLVECPHCGRPLYQDNGEPFVKPI
jgi:hypothetical protein